MTGPRPSKRERTRRKLLDAGLRVLAERGEGLTAADVVAEADVSNGTFYNHFADRGDFIEELALESLRAIGADSAEATRGQDPAWRFAVASTRVLEAAVDQPLWGRAVLRLADSPSPPHAAVQRHLRADLADGHATGRFAHGDDPVTVDLVTGTIMATLRRLTSPTRQGDPARLVVAVVGRLLEAVGVDAAEAATLATEAATPATEAGTSASVAGASRSEAPTPLG
ncbi:MAG: TetR/AcrR family transcriptional regulator [Actinomycetota bacterium]